MADINFDSLGSLKPVKKVLEEANRALNDSSATIDTSPIKTLLVAATGTGTGVAISFGALYALGTVGVSAVGITTALSVAGGIVGGGMAAGVAVLAAPVAVFGIAGVCWVKNANLKKLIYARQAYYVQTKQAIEKLNRLIEELIERLQKNEEETEEIKDKNQTLRKRLEYYNSLVIVLQAANRDLKSDIDANASAA